MPWHLLAERPSVPVAMDAKQHIAARLRRLREERGTNGRDLQQDVAAAQAGVKYRQWQRWEAAENMPKAAVLQKIAEAFEFDESEFYKSPPARSTDAEIAYLRAAVDRLNQEVAALARAHHTGSGSSLDADLDAINEVFQADADAARDADEDEPRSSPSAP